MANPQVSIILDLIDAAGAPVTRGSAVFTPTSPVPGSDGISEIVPSPVTVPLDIGSFPVSVPLIPTDISAVTDWAWHVSFAGVNLDSFAFKAPIGPVAFTAAAGTPGTVTWTATAALTGLPPGTGVKLEGGSLPGGVTGGVTYFVVNPAGQALNLSATPGGSPLALASSGSGSLTVASYYLAGLEPVAPSASFGRFLAMPSGAPAAGQVPAVIADGNPATRWTTPGGDSSGFTYIPASDGAPSGVPSAPAGKVALQFDTVSNRLWAYNGAWLPSAVFASAYDQQVISRHPVLYLPLGDSASLTPADLSGGGHDAAFAAGTSPVTSALMPNGDRAPVFDGTSQYAEVASFPALSIPATGFLSVEAWIRPDVLQFPADEGTGYVHYLGKGTVSGGSGDQEYAMRMYSLTNTEDPPRPNRTSAYAFNLSGGLGTGAYVEEPVTAGQWMMLTFVVDSTATADWPNGYISIYKNGVLRGGPVDLSQHGTVPAAASAPFRVGTRDFGSFFQGAIGKVAVYGRVLPGEEILSGYQAMGNG